jgi:PAS domain S-box-containing protein
MHRLDIGGPRRPLWSAAVPAAAAALLLVSAWLTLRMVAGVRAADRLDRLVREENGAADTLLSTLKDAETGQRGYLLTGEPEFLTPYIGARARIDADLARLEQAPLPDPGQVNHLALLKALTAAKLAELGHTVALRRAGRADEALAIVRTRRGEQVMDAIRSHVEALHALGEVRLARARATAPAARGIWPAGTAAIASLLLGGLAQQWRVRRKIIAARNAENERFSRGFGLTQSLVRDPDGRITFWGPGMEGLYGYTQEMAVGQISHELFATRFPAPLAQIEAELERNGDWNGELVHRCRDGTNRIVMSHWVLHPEVDSHRRSVVEMNFDVTTMRQAEMYLQIALDAAGLGTWSWDIGGSGVMTWDARTRELFGVPADCEPSYTLWQSVVVPDDIAAVEDAMVRLLDPADPLDQYTAEYRVRHLDGQIRWMVASGRAEFIDDPAARAGRSVLRLVGTLCDITAAKEFSLERERNSTLLRNIIETSPGPIYAKDRQGRFLVANAAVLALVGRTLSEVMGRTDQDLLDDPAEAIAVMANDRRVMESGEPQELEEVVGGSTGHARVWLSTKTPMRGADGAVIGLVGVSVEITERKRDETRRDLMIHELNHRVKNTLATVQAVASETLQGADPAMRAALDGRLMALASVHDVLTRESWHSADLGEVVAAALAPFGGAETRRFHVRGPALLLLPRAAVALAMGLHELATNATKYGALHVPEGRVSLLWEIAGDGPQTLLMTWSEQGGPRVASPRRRSFGSAMIEGALACDLGGTATIHFDVEGVRCVIEAPLDEVTADAGDFVLLSVGRS